MTDQKPPTQSPAPTKQRTHFELGEVVYLKSGSPAMTIREVIPNGQVKVTWMERNINQTSGLVALIAEASFPRECLTDQDPRLQSLKDAILSSSAEIRMPQSQALYMDSERVIRVELTGLQEVLEKALSFWLNRPSPEGVASQVCTQPLQISTDLPPKEVATALTTDMAKLARETLSEAKSAPPLGIQPIKRRT